MKRLEQKNLTQGLTRRARYQQGNMNVLAVGFLIVAMMFGAFAVDLSLLFAEQNKMLTAAESAALASTVSLFRSGGETPDAKQQDAFNTAAEYADKNGGYDLSASDVVFGYSDPEGDFDLATFSDGNPEFDSTGGFNGVNVTVRRGNDRANSAISTLLANLFGVEAMNATASATAIYGGQIQSYSGLRPVYLCQGVYNKAVELYGDPTIPEIVLYDSTNGSNGNGNGNGNGNNGNNQAAGDQETIWYYSTPNPGQFIEFWDATMDHEISLLGDDTELVMDELRVDLKKKGPTTINGTLTTQGGGSQSFTVAVGGTTTVAGYDIFFRETASGGKQYYFEISSTEDASNAMQKIKFDFGTGSTVNGPKDSYWTKRTWLEDAESNTSSGVSTGVEIGTHSLTTEESCGSMPPGSFGFADLANGNGAPGVPTVRDWWENGYWGEVTIGEGYEPQPGNQLNAYKSEIDTLIENETIIVIPIYSESSGQGSGAEFVVSGFAPFIITELTSTGNPKTIKGHFTNTICRSNCTVGSGTGEPTGITKVRLVH